MSGAGDVVKRLVLGRALRSDRQSEQELPKRLALPIFASDPLSSVAYATQEMVVVLTLGGLAYLHLTPWLATGVVVLLTTVVLSYRQLVHAYPTGGGDYQVASENLGRRPGMVVASALLVDYVLTVAVSVAAGVDNIISAFTGLAGARIPIAIGFIAFLTAMNLRGVRESGRFFAVPTYGFLLGIGSMVLYGLFRASTGDTPRAESAGVELVPDDALGGLTGLALVFFVLRAFAAGCTALTGVEAIANGVPAFRKPKSRNAATTLALMGAAALSMFVGITALAVLTDVRYVQDPASQLVGFGEGDVQRSVVAQIASAVFGDGTVLFYFVQAMTAGILLLAANTAFNGFPLLGSILAQDRLLPRQLHTRGDRLVFSNGILLLAGFAGLLVVVFDANVTNLIQLYLVGVFTSFTLGQAGMVRHWNRLLRGGGLTPQRRRQVLKSRVINLTGCTLTGTVLAVVLITKFTRGAWIVLLAMPVLYLLMRGISRHYEQVAEELEPEDELVPLPSRNHAVVLVSKVHAPTLRALSYARATRPHDITALTVNVDPDDTRRLQEQWDRRDLPVPLTVVDSPYREITRPVLEYVRGIRMQSPRDVVTVYIPEYVVGHWWEQLLHNQSALRLKSRLLFQPGVMVTSVPYQLRSSEGKDEDVAPAPGVVRRAQPIGRRLQDRERE
ncbi:MAG TPA: APC family permease [Mycobacteriales bacterium]|nr:APC family permease [Mycobacteriales bacterium]